MPRVMIPPGTVLQEGVVSELGGTVAPDALILTKAERKADYVLPEPLANGGGGAAGAAAAALASQELARRVRHRRDWEETDEKGFRRCPTMSAVVCLAGRCRRLFTPEAPSRQTHCGLIPCPKRRRCVSRNFAWMLLLVAFSCVRLTLFAVPYTVFFLLLRPYSPLALKERRSAGRGGEDLNQHEFLTVFIRPRTLASLQSSRDGYPSNIFLPASSPSSHSPPR